MLTRLMTSLGMLLALTVLTQGVALANPANVTIKTGIQRWNSTQTEPLNNIEVRMETQYLAGKIPISTAPYLNRHLGITGYGIGAQPISLNYDIAYGMNNPAAEISGNLLSTNPASTVQSVRMENFAWCGVPINGLVPGDFKFKTIITPKAGTSPSPNGGYWTNYWHWASDKEQNNIRNFHFDTGDSVIAEANNDEETMIQFVFVENPPPPPLYNVDAVKTGPVSPGGFGTPWQIARMGMDGGNLASYDVSHRFENIRADQDHTFFADTPADWTVKGYSFNNAPLAAGSSLFVGANTVGNGETRALTWYYEPLPSTIKTGFLMKNGGSLQNPCAAPSGTPGRALCGSNAQVVAQRAAGQDAVLSGTDRGTATLDGSGNPKDIGNLYPGNYNLTATGVPVGWKIVGWRECGYGDENCYTNNMSTDDFASVHSTSVAINRTRPFYYVLAPDITAPAMDVSCSTISGELSVPAGLNNIRTQVRLGNDTLPQVQNGTAYSFNQLDAYKDGLSRAIKLVVSYDDVNGGTTRTTVEIDPARNHLCANASICNGNTILQSTDNGFVTAGQTYTILVTMKNDGDSIWKEWRDPVAPNAKRGTHSIVLDPGSAAYWEPVQELVNVLPTDAPAGVTYPTSKPDSYQFKIAVRLKDAAQLAYDTPLEFKMGWADTNNITAPATLFGAKCGAIVHPKSTYQPWMRVQNGSVSALDKIVGQAGGTRGGRRTSTPSDINLDVQYAATAAISETARSNRFCSTNAYNYGRGTNANDDCTFQGYTFTIGQYTKEAYLAFSQHDDPIWRQALDMTQYTECSDATYNPARQGLRTSFTGIEDANPFATATPVNLVVAGKTRCGIVTTKTASIFGAVTGAPTNAVISGGRATWVVPHDLTINANVKNSTTWAPIADATDVTTLNAIPNLGIIVDGDVVIGAGVTEIDATIYATGRIYTCSSYPSATVGVVPATNAALCSKKLIVKGGLSARGGFALGRNYFDASHVGVPVADTTFDFKTPLGTQGGYYYGGPAEDIIGNGISLLLPPPGLEDYSANFYRAKYLPGNLSPRF